MDQVISMAAVAATPNAEITKEEKEKVLSDKIAAMKRKNEELRKRHEEIEADKQMADKHSSSVTMEDVKPYIMKTPRPKPEKAPVILNTSSDGESVPVTPIQESPRQRLTKEDGPPPDPSYSFLADPDRDGTADKVAAKNEDESNSTPDKREGRGRGYSRRGRSARRYSRGGRNRSAEEERPKRGQGGEGGYEQWKEERKKIDEARILRAQSGDGEWKREWDMVKIDQENAAQEPDYDYTFNQRRKDDTFKLKDMLTEDQKVKLDKSEGKPEQRRGGGRPNRRARMMRRGAPPHRGDEQWRHDNWREKELPDTSKPPPPRKEEKSSKFQLTTTENGTKVLVRSEAVQLDKKTELLSA